MLLWHLRGDQFDHLVQQKLKRDMPIITNAAAGLQKLGFTNAISLQTWEALMVNHYLGAKVSRGP